MKLALILLLTTLSFAQSTKPCSSPEHHQFDFWVGDWDAFDVGNDKTPSAHVRVDRILDGCVLREDYQDPKGLKGQSFTIYDAARKLWHQSWVTNRGNLLVIEGKLEGDQIVLNGTDNSKGKPTLVRGLWKPVSGGVRETAVTSADNGKTWKPWFDIIFRPKANPGASASDPIPSPDDDLKTVAALDTQYQAAVEKNDVATMEGILADNFVLVTGAGKSYTKADLLNEARSGRVVYERQDDSEQKVRLFGDTAVVTAKLTAKGTQSGKPFDYSVWFSDTYVRTPTGWRYVFGQSSLHLPQEVASH
jgi:ketosteroid isomerase-like protein